MTSADDPVVRRQIVVDAPIDKAFATFVERFGDFKPQPAAEIHTDVHVGILSRGRQRMSLGPGPRVRAPGPGGVQLGHQPDWQLETDPSHASEVEVRFVLQSPDRTRLERTSLVDRHGPGWEGVRDGVEGDAGWPLYWQGTPRLGGASTVPPSRVDA